MIEEFKQFDKPPIKEAIFTISFKNNKSAEEIDAFCADEYIKTNFPNSHTSFRIEAHLDKKHPEISQREEGYLLRGRDGFNKAITIKSSLLSYHNFDKYAGWEVMVAEFQQTLECFKNVTGSNEITQISVRYLNHVILPESENIREYFRVLPIMPEGFEDKMNNFFLQISVPDEAADLHGNITETILRTPGDNEQLNFLIDIAVIKYLELNCKDVIVAEIFKSLRSFKNKLFLSCITKKAESLFD